MNYLTHQLLNSEELKTIRNFLDNTDLCWEDGKKTAGSHASIVKNNVQLDRTLKFQKLSQLIKEFF